MFFYPSSWYTTGTCGEALPTCYGSHALPVRRARQPNVPPPQDQYGPCTFYSAFPTNYSGIDYTDHRPISVSFTEACPTLVDEYQSAFDNTPVDFHSGVPFASNGIMEYVAGNAGIQLIYYDATYPDETGPLNWTLTFAGLYADDRIYLGNIDLTLCTLTAAGRMNTSDCFNYTVATRHCVGGEASVVQCACEGCARYVTSDVLIDDGVPEIRERPETASSSHSKSAQSRSESHSESHHSQAAPLLRRKLLSMPETSTPPTDGLVSSNLNLFVRDYQVVFPANQSVAQDIATVESNRCSVLIREDSCTSNLRVYVNVDQTDYQNYVSGNLAKGFMCYVLQPLLAPPPIPLTPNVFLLPVNDWAYIPLFFQRTSVVLTTQKLVGVRIVSDTWNGTGDPAPLRFSQGVYGFEIPVPGNAPTTGTYLYCDISIDVSEYDEVYEAPTDAVPLFANTARVCMGNTSTDYDATSGTLNVTAQPLFNTTKYGTVTEIQHMQFLAAPECPGLTPCPSDGVYINQDYAVDVNYNGLMYQFPPNNLTTANATEMLLNMRVDVAIKLHEPRGHGACQQL